MLRITVNHDSESITIQLEGRLSRPWLRELHQCWRRSLADKHKLALKVDLTGLTFVDESGKAFLGAMYHEGADFIANDCLTKSIVDEITNTRISRSCHPKENTKAG